ncbi:MAG: metal ABC transporter permease, partial [Aestuariivirga sp.]|nr:metal ABC transporter permease [Aestuariivirga sp.]
VERVELGFILLIAVMTAIAMKIVGLLLITALMVIPAAAARRLATTPESMAYIAATIAGLSVVSGLLASAFIGGASGPCVVLAASCFFALTLAVPQAS